MITSGNLPTRTSYTPVVTGFSSTSQLEGYYTLINKLCIVSINVLGTSNATTFTCTLPFNADPNIMLQLNMATIRVVDNGAAQTNSGMARTRAGSSNIADFYKTLLGAGWTASGSKSASITFMYYIE